MNCCWCRFITKALFYDTNMKHGLGSGVFLVFLLLIGVSFVTSYDGPLYDFTAYTKCKGVPQVPLYNGGILKDMGPENLTRITISDSSYNLYMSSSLVLHNLTQGTIYCFSVWVKIKGAESANIRAKLKTEDETYSCIGTVQAKNGCWSFLKGGFVLDSSSKMSFLMFQNSDGSDIDISIASASLQPFTAEEWRINQRYIINTQRKRVVTVHVADGNGDVVEGASVAIEQVAKEFPFGSAIASSIIGNLPYQKWFVERFNVAVFENELKWYATEPQQGQVSYAVADKMMEFLRANQIVARGHNIFWEDPSYIPAWVLSLTGQALRAAVESRIQSLMNKYREEFIHWDVSNEMLHFDFYEQRLGPEASLHFYQTAHASDPLATLYMNEFNVVETCSDVNSTVDIYISKLRELKRGGVSMSGIGLEGHFTVPNPPLMRAVLDKMATLGLPIWLTEVDISSTIDKQTQAVYLEQVLREAFSHPSVNGMLLWTALHSNGGCYQMCLTDNNLQNLPAGDVVDKLLKEWQTKNVNGQTDGYGSYSFYGFLGEYNVSVKYGNSTVTSTFSLCQGHETKHVSIRL